MERSKVAWGTIPLHGRDPRVHWDLATLKVKKVIMAKKKNIVALKSGQMEMVIHLQGMWQEVAINLLLGRYIAEVVRLEV